MPRIAVLSEVLINKIAAGEVVERPASVVKELCENALDAGARTLRVSLAGGGLARIVVDDDGHGMAREDAELCLLRHATSKLRDLDGLFSLVSKGFRGEAVPAIASVSRFRLHTAEVGAAVGTAVTVEGGGAPVLEEAAPRVGTVVTVEDLFFNTPARRKFMKREDTELKHAEEAVIRLALAHPEVSFFVDHAGEALFTSPAAPEDPRERIAAALGAEVHPHLVPVEERRLGVSVTGHIASPEFTFPNARGLYTFVNRRYIRDRGLNSAIQRAFQEYLPTGRQPVVVIFIDVDPRAVDVNVHPQKTEVRFADPRGVGDAVNAALVRTLRAAPWLGAGPTPEAPREAAHYALAVERFLTRAQEAGGGAPLPIPGTQDAPGEPGAPGTVAPAFGQARPLLNEAPPPGYFGQLRPLGRLAGRFPVCEGRGGTLVVLDLHAALERARRATFERALAQGRSPALSLFATTVELPLPAARALVSGQEALARLGFEVEPFGGTSLAVKALPTALSGADAPALLEALSRALPPAGVPLDALALAEPLRVMACHAARAAEASVTDAQLRALLEELDDADFHLPCLHGSVVVLEMPLLELERRAR
ncbi:DNA mismatch repair endonuclease MutL [Aggregicoccus sp. 17bor-14]|uniref:DNA mismatch repair endonuclease MutL n=1 Tax=Myxococcaceae TaxID=31 RepID=UPI00129D1A2F|nr:MULTISPECIES: DNA mismatch repair endonuclease MutL [Myxococcaceae]MBF5041003.1 DNA mismatch repair endonuclease MutL [Simulacricoccus sp. 17bor-14]MRI86789.1 DNA mismatch repair endonuclease MutL [Aggregicoccus sp. 17bor-14]